MKTGCHLLDGVNSTCAVSDAHLRVAYFPIGISFSPECQNTPNDLHYGKPYSVGEIQCVSMALPLLIYPPRGDNLQHQVILTESQLSGSGSEA